MRVTQLITFGKPYLVDFRSRRAPAAAASYRDHLSELLDDRYGNSHILQPVLEGTESAQFIVADAREAQQAWARERGMAHNSELQDVVLAQIEEHRSEVLYNLTPILYGMSFLRRLPSCVKRTVCWRAAPSSDSDLDAYDLRLSNFPIAIEQWRRAGFRAAWFEPSHDPVASQYAASEDRSIDVAFVGSYSRHHATRNRLLQRIAERMPKRSVRFHMAMARSARWVNALPLVSYVMPHLALPKALRRVSYSEIYGRKMYELFGNTKIVINAAVDISNQYRGNMRCWEAMGCGALMLSDAGMYPSSMNPDVDFVTYKNADEALAQIESILADYQAWRPVARQGLATMEACYSKARQWGVFRELVAST
jgi:hypothetical protein